MLPKFILLQACLLTLLTFPSAAQAHFPWLNSDGEGRALMYFGESPLEMTYRTPEVVAKAKVSLKGAGEEASEIELATVETDEFVGRQSEANTVGTGVLTSVCNYGNYHGTLLSYYVKHYAGNVPQAAALESEKAPTGFAIDVRPSLIEKGIVLTVTRDGKPVKDSGITVFDPQGETAEQKTNKEGVAKFYNLAKGKLGFIVGVQEKTEGEVDGEKYTSASHYLTLTLDTSAEAVKAEKQAAKPPVPSALTPLPEAVASFGAAMTDDHVYVYSGHIGRSHSHSRDNYSMHFRRLPLAGGEWEELPMQHPLQGLALVPHEGKIYRIGGMYSFNPEGKDEDMRSIATVAVFDPETKRWSDLPSLPEPRSSHDAVVVDGTLYVVGGWTLDGSDDGDWIDTAWKLDLANTEEGWQSIAKPTFLRRALTASFVGDTLVVIGGIDDSGDISRAANALDLASGKWRDLPELPGDGMQGFGVSAWNHEGQVYISGSSGIVYTLNEDLTEWKEAARHADHRFFHRLLPAGEGRLLMIGGASMDRQAHVADSEWVELNAE